MLSETRRNILNGKVEFLAIQREYPSVKSTHDTKVSIGTAKKELGFEHKEHSHVAYYKVVPLHTA